MTSTAIPRSFGPTFNDRRNTSRVFPVPPDALPAALDELRRFREREPELVEWIEAGAPRLTHAEHRARFGVDYGGTAPARPSTSSRFVAPVLVDEALELELELGAPA